jgi:DNA-binding NarL/FixJ family response regulator
LTERELDVLCALARGGTMKQMARELGMAPKTVDHHLQRIYPKLGVSTRAGATLVAMERGYVAGRH